MPFASIGNVRIFYRLEGAQGRPVLVLSHSIGTDHQLWALQMPDLLQYYHVLRYDTRGHGASDAPEGEYSVDLLGTEALALADSLGIETFGFCGLSMGGAVGQWLALNAPHRLTHLVLADTSSSFGAPEMWDQRRTTVLTKGMAAVLDVALQRSFSSRVLASDHPCVGSVKAVVLGTNPIGYAGCCAALRDFDSTGQLCRIQTPTLVITGEADISTPWAGHGEVLATHIKDAVSARIPGAHLSNLESPRAFTSAVLEFLMGTASADAEQSGFVVRRQVLGDKHVAGAIAATTGFTREFQSLITRYAWGSVWARPGLDQRTRRLLVLTATAALGRWEEFRLHLRAALAGGLEPCELKEMLLQTAIYAGVPAANTGFHIAEEELSGREPA